MGYAPGMQGALVLTVSSRALVQACERLGIDTDAMLETVGVERSLVFDVDARIPGDKVSALWQEAYRRADDPDLSLHAVEALPRGAYKVLEFLAATSASVGEGLRRVSRYFRLINSAVELPVDEGPEHVTFGFTSPGAVSAPSRAYAEYAVAAIVLRTRLAVDIEFPLQHVDFAYPSPTDISEHERIFGCPVHFDAPRTQMCIARDVWDRAVSADDGGLSELLEQHAKMLLDKLPEGTTAVAQVQEAIRKQLRGGDPNLDNVARALGMSSRTLQRRLKDEGLSYATVLDETRANVARSYLDQPEFSLAEVGYLLGFADQSSFTRAFKRWTGSTPGTFRANSHC